MADDPDARIAQLEAELRQTRDEKTALAAKLADAREQQAAAAEILRMVASSRFDLTGVLDALATRAYQLCGGSSGRLYLADGDVLRVMASVADSNEMLNLVRSVAPVGLETPLSLQSAIGRSVIESRPIHIEDAHSEQARAEYPQLVTGGVSARTRLHVPLQRDGQAIGALVGHAAFR